jgi:hypothetical protein
MSRRVSGSEGGRRTVVKRIKQRVLVLVEMQFLFHAGHVGIFNIGRVEPFQEDYRVILGQPTSFFSITARKTYTSVNKTSANTHPSSSATCAPPPGNHLDTTRVDTATPSTANASAPPQGR